ncbi:serine/threonine-protein kinase SSN3 [Cryptococcus amylolentus CBS 6039]|uniref:Serine/threonine-protein kinase SSN3 n=1 Tax=Cryptococcus amylolentus CBS 6039 TaxID=1295533 RepID=A0A1E3HNA2_9TREE|nr:serine/threonine-protein kinase SSN3 [Cryptococcus amylolentus CBS 6039]ODN77804.1 serine/threonine-protein kinase SSN3 [Cryptococcus amylolentus CBS 6039]
MATTATLDPMHMYRAKRDAERRGVLKTYKILGFISSGTYGRVYKAILQPPSKSNIASALPSSARVALSISKDKLPSPSLSDKFIENDPLNNPEMCMRPGDRRAKKGDVFAIKKFKPDKEGDVLTYAGISQSGAREIMLNRELHHRNLVSLREVILEDKSIYMVFEYAEHDFLQIIHHHSQTARVPIPPSTLRRLLHQLLCGVHFLHSNFVLHRDLKPANILVTNSGVVKIGDLGLARLWHKPLAKGGLYGGDKVVVTIWYRAPELILGSKHYTAAVDIWAVGCIYAELLSLRPLFKGDEAKMDGKKTLPFQRDQMGKICEVLGPVKPEQWPGIVHMPEYRTYQATGPYPNPNPLPTWYHARSQSTEGYDLLVKMFEWDPARRVTAKDSLKHPWFQEDGGVAVKSVFEGSNITYPTRRVTHEDNGDAKMGSLPASMAGGPRLPSSSNFKPASATINQSTRKKARI